MVPLRLLWNCFNSIIILLKVNSELGSLDAKSTRFVKGNQICFAGANDSVGIVFFGKLNSLFHKMLSHPDSPVILINDYFLQLGNGRASSGEFMFKIQSKTPNNFLFFF